MAEKYKSFLTDTKTFKALEKELGQLSTKLNVKDFNNQ